MECLKKPEQEEHTFKLQKLSLLKSFTKKNTQLLLHSFEENNNRDCNSVTQSDSHVVWMTHTNSSREWLKDSALITTSFNSQLILLLGYKASIYNIFPNYILGFKSQHINYYKSTETSATK